MPRLFTAIALPDDIRLALTGLRGGLRGARWIDPENYHLTLRFIGDVDLRTADEVAAALLRVRRAPVAIEVSGLGSFGNKKPHSVWAKVKPTAALTELQAEQERLCQRIGLPPESRRFTPHITLGRLKGASAAETAGWLALRGGFARPPFMAERIELLSSRDSVGGGPYLSEMSVPLTLAAAA